MPIKLKWQIYMLLCNNELQKKTSYPANENLLENKVP